MDARIATMAGDLLRRLPAEGVARDLALQRLTDLYAEREAGAAVRAASARGRETLRQSQPQDAAVLNALLAASALCDLEDRPAESGTDLAAEAARREEIARAILDPDFLAVVPDWAVAMRQIAALEPGSGACTIASAMQLWSWSVDHLRREAVSSEVALSELAQAFCRLIAARAQILEVAQEARGTNAETRQLYLDLCHVQSARASGEVAALCAEIVFGYRRHARWDADGCASCYRADDLEALEGLIPGIESTARGQSDVIEADGSHPMKAGPCAKTEGLDAFVRLRAKLDGCLTGARLAKARAAAALPSVLAATVR